MLMGMFIGMLLVGIWFSLKHLGSLAGDVGIGLAVISIFALGFGLWGLYEAQQEIAAMEEELSSVY